MTLDYHCFIRPNGPKGTNATNDHSRLQCVPSVLVLLVHNPVDCFRFFVEVGSEIILRFLHFGRQEDCALFVREDADYCNP
jgi:hypothetical protein